MKKIKIGVENTVYFDAQEFNVSGLTVTASVLGESGDVLLNGSNAELKDLATSFDGDKKKYRLVFTLSETTGSQYAGIYWQTESNLPIPDDFSPEYVEIVEQLPVGKNILMPVSVFTDRFLRTQANVDAQLKTVLDNFTNQNRDYVQQELLSAQGTIEQKIKMRIFTTKAKMDRDFYSEPFRTGFWMQVTDYRPIISVDKYQLIYGSKGLEITQDIAQHMVVDPRMGTIEFLPTTLHGSLFTALISHVHALGITIAQDGGYNRIPLLFQIEYRHGLWEFPEFTPAHKESMRNAVARHALINLLPRIDPLVRKTSESKSIDGASKSRSGGVSDIIKTYREEEEKWVDEIKREFAMHIDMAVA